MEQKIRKPVAWLLTLAMLFTMLPSFTFTALAADNICAHHAEHTAECGYVEGVSDCAYHCHVCHVQELIDALPDEVTAENADTVAAHLDAIDLAKAELTADELALLDLTKYTAAAQALGALAAAEVTCDCGTDDALIHATTCAVYVAPENPVCYCTEKCSDTNVWCDVCGFDYTQCGGTDTATVYADDWFTVSGNTVTIDGTLGGNAATDADITALVDAIKDYVDSGITTITVTGSNPAIIDTSSYTNTAIGEAIYRLSGNGPHSADNPYNGKIDLILPDVTEIVDYEFQNAHALNSINLPKVNTIGVKGIDSCFYLQELTFGSVVSIKDSSDAAFVDVGKSVDGGLCDLVLSCGQAFATEYQPNLDSRLWCGREWKSITQAHSGGEATGICTSCYAVRITGYAPNISGMVSIQNAASGTATGLTNPTGSLHFNWGANSQVYAELWDATKKLLSETVTAQPDETNDNYMRFSFAGRFVGTPTNVLATYGIGDDLTATMPNEFTQSATSDPSFLNDYVMLQGSGAYGGQVNFTHIPALFGFKITNKRDTYTTIDSVSIRLVDETGNICPIASSNVTLTASAGGWTTAFSGEYDKITTTINAELMEGAQYRAYAAALPLPGTDPLKGKTMQFVLNLEDGESYEAVVYEIDAESIAVENGGSYNWVGGEMLEFEIMTDTNCIDSVTAPFVEKELDSVCAVKDSTDTSDFAAAAPAPPILASDGSLHNCSIGVTTTNAINTNSVYNVTNNEWVNDDTDSREFDTSNDQLWVYGSTLTAYAPYSQDYPSITYDLANNGNYLLYGKSDTVTGSYSDLTLEHKLASLYVSGLTGTTLQNVELSGIYTTATFDGSTGTLTPTGNKGAIGIDVDRKEILLIPMEEGEVTLRIQLSDGSVYTTKMNLAIEAGTYYNLPVRLGHTGTASYTVNEDDNTKHDVYYSCCGTTVTEDHSGGSYSVSGAVITDSCTKCGTELGTATISATGKTYDGSAVEADVTKTGSLAEKTIAITYAVKGGATLEGAPENAGTYTASITMGEGENAVTASVEFTIVRKPVTATVTAQDKTYDGNTTATVTATVASADLVSGDSITITGLTGTFSDANAGADKAVTVNSSGVSITGTNADCYQISYPNTTATISPKEVTNPTITLEKTSYEYTGKAIQPAVTVKDGDTTLTAGTDYDVTCGENKNAGTGSVTVALKGNYSGSKTVEFAISKVTLTVTADNKTMTTGYALPTFTYTITGFVNGETESVLTTKPVAETSTDGKTAGTFDITVSGAAADNYDFTYVKGILSVVEHQHDWTYTAKDGTITAKCGNASTCPATEQSITISAVGKTYDGTPVTATLTGSIDGVDTLEITYCCEGGCKDAKTHTASITIEGVTAEAEFSIEKATIGSVSITVTAPEAGAEPQTTVTAGTGYTAAIEWKETVTQFGFNTAYTAIVTLTADSNHKFASNLTVDGWTVSNTEGVLTLTKTFDATRKAKLEELTGAPADKTLTGYYTAVSGAIAELPTEVTYTTESGNVTVDIEWTCDNYDSTTKATNIFKWSVKDGELNNYDVNNIETSGTITVTNVDALPVTNTGSDTEITYDGSTYDVSKMFTKDKNAGEATYAITGGTGTGTLNGSTLTITKAGTIEITMTTAANDPYAAGSVTATLTVNKANAAVTTAPTANDLTYTGSAQALVTTGEAKGGTMVYSLTEDGTYTEAIPAGIGADTYTVYYKVVGDSNHNDTEAKSVTVTIAKAELTATISGSVTKTYDGTTTVPNGLSITLDGVIEGDTVSATASYAYSGKDVGTTKINATDITLGGADASNYVLTNTTASADVGTITKAAAPAIVWPAASSLVYGQTLSASTLTSTDSNGTFAWKNGSTVPTVTNSGYVVVYTPKDTGNYDYSNVTLEKTISVTVTAADQADFSISGATTATYGDAPITLNAAGGSGTGTITWEITSGDQFASIDQNGVVTIKGAGTVTVKATKAADGNYKEKVDTHQITISKATVDADNFAYKAPTDLVYSKTAKEATVTGNSAYGAITIKYYSDSRLTTVVQPINVGTYYVGITAAGGNNYEAVTAPMYVGSFTITARTVTVKADAKTMQYGDDVPELTYTHNLLEGDSFTGSLATTATKTSDVGEYDITIGDLANSNYSISFTGAKLTITKADGPAAPTVTGSYVDNGMTYTYTVDAISGAEYSKDGTTWQDSNVFANLVAGQKYTFYARIKETKNVLAGAIGTSAEVDLSKLPGKGTATIDDWTYGETAQAPVTGSTTGNAVESYLYESTDGKGYSSANAPTNAGEYKLTVTFAATATHNGTTASDTFTIKKATPAVTAPTGLTATYGDTLASVQLPEGWAWKDAATTEVGNAGENTFTVIYTHPTNAANHEQVEKTVTITVAPKAVTATVTVVGENFIFNGSEQKPGVTVKDGDITIPESEYTVSYKDNTNAGTATVTVTDKDGGNYTVTGETTFAIAKKASSALSGVEREFMRTIATTGNEIDVEAMLPDDHGTVTYTITSSGYTVLENVAVDANGKLVFDTKTSAAAASDTITVKVEMQNYTDVTLTVSVILNDKAPQEITGVSAAAGLIYNGEAQKGYTGTPASDYTGAYEITYTGRDNSYNSSAAPVNAGDYTVTFKIPDSDLYYSGNISINFTIGKAQATVTADDKEAYIGSRMPELTYKVSGLIGSDTISVELSCDANMNRAGETPIVVTATDPNGNYEITTVNGTLTVKYYPYIPSTPSNPPATEVTVPISGDDNTIHVEAEVSGDKAIIDHVDLDHLDEVIGDHVDTGTVTIDFSGLDTKEPITTVEIPANVVKEIASAVNDPHNDADSLEIILSDGTSIEFDAEALGEKAAQARGQDITISIESHEDVKLTNAQKNALGNRPAYDINVTSGGKHISDMGGKITVHAPYELKSGEKAEGIVVYYVDENGNRERCETSYDPIKKRVNWKTDHLSLYMIDYDESLIENCKKDKTCPMYSFTDLDMTAWYHDGVHFCIANDLMKGTSNTTFAPGMTTSRAMIVTILWRLEGEPTVNGGAAFSDVANGKWYSEAIKWAAANNIVNGYGNGLFGPDDIITREQLATILYRYEQYKGGGFTGAWMIRMDYVDLADVSDWAYEAMCWMNMNGIVNGKPGKVLDPKGSATRAEAATMLYRYCEVMTKEDDN